MYNVQCLFASNVITTDTTTLVRLILAMQRMRWGRWQARTLQHRPALDSPTSLVTTTWLRRHPSRSHCGEREEIKSTCLLGAFASRGCCCRLNSRKLNCGESDFASLPLHFLFVHVTARGFRKWYRDQYILEHLIILCCCSSRHAGRS